MNSTAQNKNLRINHEYKKIVLTIIEIEGTIQELQSTVTLLSTILYHKSRLKVFETKRYSMRRKARKQKARKQKISA